MKYGENLTKEVIIMPLYREQARNILSELEELIKNDAHFNKLDKKQQKEILTLVEKLRQFFS